jgi:DnaJ-class molecular chaperone
MPPGGVAGYGGAGEPIPVVGMEHRCPKCDGSGLFTPDPVRYPNAAPGPCRSCNGRGMVFVAAEPDVHEALRRRRFHDY